jgi:pimeloyl-ACP methyl ester carboxylesterase
MLPDEAGAVTTLVLPGLDGTGALLAPFARAMPEGAQVRIASYPADEPLGYQALADRLSRDLAPGPLALVAESFAGPLALRLAAQAPASITKVVLVGTFIRPPVIGARWLRLLAAGSLLSMGIPAFLIRQLLLDDDASDATVELVRENLARVRPAVLAARLRALLEVDASDALRASRMPLLCLWASRDRLVGSRCAAEIRALRPDAREVVIDAPHLLLYTRPAQAAAAIAPFLTPFAPSLSEAAPS